MPTTDVAPQNLAELLAPLACERHAAASALEEKPREVTSPAAPDARASAREIEALYKKHRLLVYRLALRYGKGNVAWAEDITQEVFLDLMKALPDLADRQNLSGWFYRATTNRCFYRMRRERFLSLPPVQWLLGERQPKPAEPDTLAIARDDLRRALEAVGALPVKEQVAFSMYYLDGKEQEEIGEILGHSKSYVCKLIQRAVEKLGASGWEVSP